jgi:hypothetical protein
MVQLGLRMVAWIVLHFLPALDRMPFGVQQYVVHILESLYPDASRRLLPAASLALSVLALLLSAITHTYNI